MPISRNTDKHLCVFILSPFLPSGLRSFKKKYNLEFPETSRQVSNRLEYLKHLRRDRFVQICNEHGIVSQICEEEDSSDSDYSSRDDTESITDSDYDLEDPTSSYKAEVPTPSRAIRPIYPSCRNRRMSPKEFAMRVNHQSHLNFEHPHLNFNGMMWFRDDDVLINQSLRSILTVYQPLYDPRDFNDIKLCFDMKDPSLLSLYHPNVPTFMHKDVENIHHQEFFENNPTNSQIYSFTAKTHKEVATKVAKSERNKIQITYCRLPFRVSCEQFSNIDNTRGEAEKHYRKIRVMVTEKIKDTCSYIFWKILIEEEATHFRAKRPTVRDKFDEAEERLSKMCKTVYLED